MTIDKIPVTVVSGFLGSGKTTLLNRLLASPTDDVSGKEGPAHIIVIVNELGAIGLEHTMVRHVKDSVVLLESGCLCCTVRGQLVDTLRDLFLAALHRKIPVFSRIIIETTGIADPAAISYTLKYERFLSDRYRYDGCVSVVDAVFGLWQLENEPVSVKQAVLADVLVISKTDLAAPEQLAGLRQSLHFLNPHALQLLATDAPGLQHVLRESSLCANVARIGFGSRPRTDSGTASRTGSWLEGGPPPATAHGNVRTLTMSWGHPIERSAFLKAISTLHEDDDIDVLRLKGVVWLRGDDKASAFHGVHGQLYPLTTLQDSSEKGTSVLVLIFRRPDTMELERRLARLLPGGCRVTM